MPTGRSRGCCVRAFGGCGGCRPGVWDWAVAFSRRPREQPRTLSLGGRPIQPLPCAPPHGAGSPEAPESSGSADVISGPEEGDFGPRQQLVQSSGCKLPFAPFARSKGLACLWPGPSLLPGVLPDMAKHTPELGLGGQERCLGSEVRHVALLNRRLLPWGLPSEPHLAAPEGCGEADGSPCPGSSPRHRARPRSPLSFCFLICHVGLVAFSLSLRGCRESYVRFWPGRQLDEPREPWRGAGWSEHGAGCQPARVQSSAPRLAK